MDRRANGGVAVNDVRVMAKHPDSTVDVHSIDNHEIASIHLVPSGVVALTPSGEVIIIMHQHACYGKNNIIHSSPQIEHYKKQCR